LMLKNGPIKKSWPMFHIKNLKATRQLSGNQQQK